MGQRKGPGRDPAVLGRRIDHRHLIECWRKAQARTGSKEEDVVLVSIRVSDERTESVKPSEAASIFVSETSGLRQQRSRARP